MDSQVADHEHIMLLEKLDNEGDTERFHLLNPLKMSFSPTQLQYPLSLIGVSSFVMIIEASSPLEPSSDSEFHSFSG